MDTVIKILTLITFGLVIVIIFSMAITRQDKVRCYQLLSQSKEFANFYLTQNEYDMCRTQGIIINAEVK